jgi:hypothetical protein
MGHAAYWKSWDPDLGARTVRKPNATAQRQLQDFFVIISEVYAARLMQRAESSVQQQLPATATIGY